MNAYITSSGAFLPGPPVDNDQIEDILGRVDGRRSRLKSRILKANGILTRHYAIDAAHRTTHSNADMAIRAARACLSASPVPMRSIGLLSYLSGSATNAPVTVKYSEFAARLTGN